MTKTKPHVKVDQRLGWDSQMDLNSLEFQDLLDKTKEVEAIQNEESFASDKYQKFFKGWLRDAKGVLSSIALARTIEESQNAQKGASTLTAEELEKANQESEKDDENAPKGDDTPKTKQSTKKVKPIALEIPTPKLATIKRNSLIPELYHLQKKGNDEGHSDGYMSEISEDDSQDGGNRYKKKGATKSDSDSDGSGFIEVRRKSRKRRGHDTDSNSSTENETRVKFDLGSPKATYERKFIYKGELMADNWADANLSQAEHCSTYAAMVSSAKLQSMSKTKFMKVIRFLVLDGEIIVPETSLTERSFDQNQTKAIQEIIGTTIPIELVDSLTDSMDGSVFGAAQYEKFQQKTDKWLKENVKLSSPTTNKILKLTQEGYLQSIGQLPQFFKDIRWKSVDELRYGSSNTADQGASDTKNTIGKWANNVQTSSSSSSSSVIPKKQSKDMNSTTPLCLLGTPMSGNLHSCGNVSTSDMLFWRDWNQTLNKEEKLALYMIHVDSFVKHHNSFMSTNLLTASNRYNIALYAGYQRLLYDLILQITTKLSLKYPHMIPTVTDIQKLGEETPELDDLCMKSKVVPPSLLSKYAHVTSQNVHLGAMAFDVFLKAHHQTGKKRTMDKLARILTKPMVLEGGLLAHYQDTRREFVEFASTRPFENSGRDTAPPVTIQIDDSLFMWHYKGEAEDLLNKLSGSELVQFQLFYKELVELNTVDEIGNLVEQYHRNGIFLPTGRGDTFAAGSYGGGQPPVERSLSELKSFGEEVERALLEAGVEEPMFLYKGIKVPNSVTSNSVFQGLTSELKMMIKSLRHFGVDAYKERKIQKDLQAASTSTLKKGEPANNNKKIKTSSPQPTASASLGNSSVKSLSQAELDKQIKQQIAQAVKLQVDKALKAQSAGVTTATTAAAQATAPATPMNPDSSNTKTKNGKGDGKGGGKGGKGAGGKGGDGKGGKGGKGKGGKGQNNNWNNWNNNQYWNNGWGDSYGWGSGN